MVTSSCCELLHTLVPLHMAPPLLTCTSTALPFYHKQAREQDKEGDTHSFFRLLYLAN